MIVGGVSFCVPALQFRPAAPTFPAPNPLSAPALVSLFCALLHHQIEAHLLPFQPLPHSLAKTPGVSPTALPQLFNNLFNSLRKSFRINTYRRSPRFSRNQPKSSARKSFRFRTYKKSICKPFRIRTYKKKGYPTTSH